MRDNKLPRLQQLAKSQEGYVAGLEEQARTLGLTSAEVRAYELAEKGLTGALQARAAAALAALAADEKKRQADATARTNAGLEAEYLRATGRTCGWQQLKAALWLA
ncbi:hypothetical protein [Pseudomonas aeruginosa]|uniref:hypothetical protein n=1 Tax=Pseudomonas aeruginosa TaxID=287 RepID=UPI003AAD3400